MSSFVHHAGLSTPEERETLEADVLFVGGGPASLSGAYHLSRLIEEHNRRVEAGGAKRDDIFYLTTRKSFRVPYLPPIMSNHGNKVVSLAKLTRWLAGLVEQAGVNVFPGFAGVEILEDGSRVAGVRTGDKGINAAGERKGNFEPGIDLRARVTVFGDGPRGYLSKELIRKRGLSEGRSTQTYETGVKEVLEMPAGRAEPGRVVHTMGYPFRRDCVGGTWIYHMADNLVSVGLVVPLDARDPLVDQHRLFQQFKQHPFVKRILEGGKPVQYGGKVIGAGGYYSMPKLCTDGAILIGEAASMVDMQRFKGVHLGMKAGMLAAERIFECIKKGDFSETALAPYEEDLRKSYVGQNLRRVRHFHRAVSYGLPRAFFHIGIQTFFGGTDIVSHAGVEEDCKTTRTVARYHGRAVEAPAEPAYDGAYTLDKLSDVYISGTQHNEDQPSHLKILDRDVCINQCVDAYLYPCNRFCPAKVYEMLREDGSGKLFLRVNFTNCVHCQTCDIKCPLNNIRWTPPEGGQGPKYTIL
jgi:electron-transferring-flavoprotein dehydrogenase